MASRKMNTAQATEMARRIMKQTEGAKLAAAWRAVDAEILKELRAMQKENPHKFTRAQYDSGCVRVVETLRATMPNEMPRIPYLRPEGTAADLSRDYIDGKHRETISFCVSKKFGISIAHKDRVFVHHGMQHNKAFKALGECLASAQELWFALERVLVPGRSVAAILQENPYLAKFFKETPPPNTNLLRERLQAKAQGG